MAGNSKFIHNYDAPNDLHLIIKNAYQKVILDYLIQLGNGYKSVFASQNTLRLGLMSKPSADDAIDALVEYGFIKRIKHPLPKSNEYVICYDTINLAIKRAMDIEVLGKRAQREYSQKEKNAMTIRQAVANPELAHKAEEILGNAVVEKSTGRVIENDKDADKSQDNTT